MVQIGSKEILKVNRENKKVKIENESMIVSYLIFPSSEARQKDLYRHFHTFPSTLIDLKEKKKEKRKVSEKSINLK